MGSVPGNSHVWAKDLEDFQELAFLKILHFPASRQLRRPIGQKHAHFYLHVASHRPFPEFTHS